MKEELFVPQILQFDEFRDLEFINVISQGWQNRWTYVQTGTTEVKLWIFTTPRMQFSKVDYDNAIMIESSPPYGTVQLSFIRTNGLCNTNNQKLEKYELLIIESGEDTNYLANESNEIFTIVCEKSFFSRMFYGYFEEDFKQIRSDYKVRLDEYKIDSFIQKLHTYYIFFQNKNAALTNEMFFSIEENILETLFSLLITSDKKVFKAKEHTVKARKILEENVTNIYKITDLIQELHISGRTLQYSFQEHLGMTPKQYLQYLRLSAIRKELLSARYEKKNISDIIAKYGYFHPSSFTVAYKNFFGETPTQTLSKI